MRGERHGVANPAAHGPGVRAPSRANARADPREGRTMTDAHGQGASIQSETVGGYCPPASSGTHRVSDVTAENRLLDVRRDCLALLDETGGSDGCIGRGMREATQAMAVRRQRYSDWKNTLNGPNDPAGYGGDGRPLHVDPLTIDPDELARMSTEDYLTVALYRLGGLVDAEVAFPIVPAPDPIADGYGFGVWSMRFPTVDGAQASALDPGKLPPGIAEEMLRKVKGASVIITIVGADPSPGSKKIYEAHRDSAAPAWAVRPLPMSARGDDIRVVNTPLKRSEGATVARQTMMDHRAMRAMEGAAKAPEQLAEFEHAKRTLNAWGTEAAETLPNDKAKELRRLASAIRTAAAKRSGRRTLDAEREMSEWTMRAIVFGAFPSTEWAGLRSNVQREYLTHPAGPRAFGAAVAGLFAQSSRADTRWDAFRDGVEPLASAIEAAADERKGDAPAPQIPEDESAMLAPADIATKYHVPFEALRKRLERWRRNNHQGWIENSEAGSRTPRFLYRVGAIRCIIEELRASGAASSKRPAKK